MKIAAAVVVGMFLLMVPLGGVWQMLLQPIIGGGVEQSFIYPIYAGIILLSGIVAGCTSIIVGEIRSLKKDQKEE